ncbi:MAG: PilZ domain-containing protein [Candidatus Aminicenantes bacterium]|nr:PilZ domain-containing protein [Candidatus Aminicenantes bacterium]
MEKRKSRRIKVHQFADINGNLGVLNDLSVHGVQVSTSLLPRNRKIEVSFEADGKLISLSGVIQWIQRKNGLINLNRLGVSLQDPPVEYRRYVMNYCAL